MPCHRRLQILAVAHLALGVLTGVLAPVELRTLFEFKHILIVPFFASAFCQSFLLSLWGVASQTMLWTRLAGLVTGVLYLEAMAGDLRREFPGIWTITVIVTMGSSLVLRRFGVIVKRLGDLDQPARPESKGPRFSIRSMMIVTVAVAVLCAEARSLGVQRFLINLVFAICFVAAGLVSLWAALGDVRPLRRGPAVFVLWAALGAFMAVPATTAGRAYIHLIMALYPAALVGSLLIVRSCGYRLVRRASAEWIGMLCSASARQAG